MFVILRTERNGFVSNEVFYNGFNRAPLFRLMEAEESVAARRTEDDGKKFSRKKSRDTDASDRFDTVRRNLRKFSSRYEVLHFSLRNSFTLKYVYNFHSKL